MDRRAWLRDRIGRFHPLWAGKLCLDFANTVEPRGGPPPVAAPPGFVFRDELGDYADLVAWTVHAGALGEAVAADLLTVAARHPAEAIRWFAAAIELREATYRVFWATARGHEPQAADLATIHAVHAAGVAAAVLLRSGEGFRVAWDDAALPLDRPLWPIAAAAVDLLTGESLGRVKVCPGGPRSAVPCGWLFYDATKNRNRHWCSMSDCGDATKSQRRADRRRATGERPSRAPKGVEDP